jgi:5'-nucleotidase
MKKLLTQANEHPGKIIALLVSLTIVVSLSFSVSGTAASEYIERAEFAEMLSAAFEMPAAAFKKVPGPEGEFLNREQAIFLLAKALAEFKPEEVNLDVLKEFVDMDELSAWAKNPMAFALEIGLYSGIVVDNEKYLEPKEFVTREEALKLLEEARYPLVTVLSTNDFHGRLLPTFLRVGPRAENAGGAAFLMGYINKYEAENPKGTVLVDAGDLMQGTPISNLLYGESTVDVYNHMGCIASSIGNHEFDWGQDIFKQRIDQAEFAWLSANIFIENTDERPDWILPYAFIEVKSMKVALIGFTTVDTPFIVMPGNVAGLEFRDPAPIVNELVPELREEGAKLVIIVAHMGGFVKYNILTGEVADLAMRITEKVDLIVSGHTHTKITMEVNGIPIIQAYSSGTALGKSDLRVDRLYGGVRGKAKLDVITTWNKDIVPDPEIADLVRHYEEVVRPIVERVIGIAADDITRTRTLAGEMELGNLISDAQRWKTGAEIAFMNPGGIRADIRKGPVTWGNLYEVQPFGNELVTMYLTGEQIWRLLNQCFPPYQPYERILQVSGIRYVWKYPENKIVSITLEDGTPIDNVRKYFIVANRFIATGGDKFTVFLEGENVMNTWIVDLDALIEYIQTKWQIPAEFDAVIENRIIRIP